MSMPLLFGQEAEAVGVAFLVCYLACIGISIIIGILSFVFWIWMLIDCIQNEANHPDNQLVVWVLVISLAGAFGALIYYFVRKINRHPGNPPPHQYYSQQPPFK